MLYQRSQFTDFLVPGVRTGAGGESESETVQNLTIWSGYLADS